MLNRFYLKNLKHNNPYLYEYLTGANLFIQNSRYSDELHDEMLRNALVFEFDSTTVCEKWIGEGNNQPSE